jgi:hypothetical protein
MLMLVLFTYTLLSKGHIYNPFDDIKQDTNNKTIVLVFN